MKGKARADVCKRLRLILQQDAGTDEPLVGKSGRGPGLWLLVWTALLLVRWVLRRYSFNGYYSNEQAVSLGQPAGHSMGILNSEV